MCFDLDSRPPIDPIAGGALDSAQAHPDRGRSQPLRRVPGPGDRAQRGGRRDPARRSRPAPVLRGARAAFAEHGVDALAIDYFGRTAGRRAARRGVRLHAPRRADDLGWDRADIAAAVDEIRAADGDRPAPRAIFTLGFCMGGRMSFLASTLGLGPGRCHGHVRHARRAVAQRCPGAASMSRKPAGSGRRSSGLFGGADAGITAEAVASFDAALGANGVDHRIVTYPGAPHSFFDRKAAEFADASAAAWSETLGFIEAHTPAG